MSIIHEIFPSCRGRKGGENPGWYLKQRFQVPENVQMVNFAKDSSLTDCWRADACVEIATSDGNTGTISHVSIACDPVLFARDLRDFLGQDEIPVCLVGAACETSGDPAYQLAVGLLENLSTAGFVVSAEPDHSDLFGLCTRQSTLFADKVLVNRRPYGSGRELETRTLRFPKVVGKLG